MAVDVATATVSIIGALVSSGGFLAIITAWTGRKKAPADIASQLSDAAMRQVEQLQEERNYAVEAERALQATATSLRFELEDARLKLRLQNDETTAQMMMLKREAEYLAGQLSAMISWIHDPRMSLARLRIMVPMPAAATTSSDPDIEKQ